MKILHCIPALAKGGAERVVIDLANHAAEAGHHVTVLALYPTDIRQWPGPLHENIELRFIVSRKSPTLPIYLLLPFWMRRNRTWLLEQDVVHCHLTSGSVFGTALQWLRSGSGAKRPAVVETNHSVGMAVPKWRRAFHALRLSGRDAAVFMAEDPYWRAFIAARPNGLWRVIPNGVEPPSPADPTSVERYRRHAGIPDGVPVVGSVGRLLWERRPDLLLETFAQLADVGGVDVHLLLAGEGPMRSELEAQARRLGLDDKVHLPGLILNPADAFGVTDLYLTVNVGKITGIAALEAAFAGLPIAAIQLDPSHQRSADEWIWASSDPKELARYVVTLLARPAELKKLAKQQQAHVIANHSVGAMADAYERLYQEALARRGITVGAKN